MSLLPVRTFRAKIKTEIGAVHPDAFVCIRSFAGAPATSYESDGFTGHYNKKSTFDVIPYEASYYVSVEAKEEGYLSAPLLQFIKGEDESKDEEGNIIEATTNKFEKLHYVNMEHSATREILSGTREIPVMVLDAIQADIIRRFE